MYIKSEKGITGIDVTVAILVITIFMSVLGALMYGLDTSSKSIQRKTEATYQAINEIENIKNLGIDNLDSLQLEGFIDNTSFYKEITILDYADFPENQDNPDIKSDIVKKVTVKIRYKDGKNEETVELSTILSKES